MRADGFQISDSLIHDAQVLVKIRVLRQISAAQFLSPSYDTAFRLYRASDDFRQGGFSAAVDANQPDLVIIVNGQVDAGEQRFFGITFFFIFQLSVKS